MPVSWGGVCTTGRSDPREKNGGKARFPAVCPGVVGRERRGDGGMATDGHRRVEKLDRKMVRGLCCAPPMNL